MWENMGRCLENVSPPVVWNFTPKCSDKMLKKLWLFQRGTIYHIIVLGPGQHLPVLLDVTQHTQGEERENIQRGIMAKLNTESGTPEETMEAKVYSFSKG